MATQAELVDFIPEIIQCYKDNVSMKNIAKKYGCAEKTIYRILQKNNVKIKQSRSSHIFSQDHIDRAAELFEEGKSIYFISKEIGFSHSAVNNKLRSFGYDIVNGWKRRDDPLRNHVSEIIELYNSGIGAETIGKKYFNTTSTQITNILKENGIEIRGLETYDVNESFFEIIDSSEKAYYLGILYSDGNLEGDGCFRVGLTDFDVIYKLKETIQYEGPIYDFIPKRDDALPQKILAIHRKKMYNDLLKLGLMPAKSLILKFPTEEQVPDYLIKHFIRGYYDGDGGITTCLSNIAFIGTIETMTEIKNKIKHIVPNPSIFKEKITKENVWRLRFGGKLQNKRFLDWLYEGSTELTRMDRKYNLYKQLCQDVESRYGVPQNR